MIAQDFEKVQQVWPTLTKVLFVPHTERDYRRLVGILDVLIDTVGEDEDHPLASLMDIIGVLIEAYETQHVPELVEA